METCSTLHLEDFIDGIVEFSDLLSVLSNLGRCWKPLKVCNELTGLFLLCFRMPYCLCSLHSAGAVFREMLYWWPVEQ